MANEAFRAKTVQCRLSDDEFKEIERKSSELGLSVSSYLRMICLKADVKISVNFDKNNVNIEND